MTTDIVVQQPNEFVLTTGKETFITYSTTSINGEPLFNYKTQLANGNRQFRGKEIETQETQIGTLVTVILDRPNPDVGGNEVKLSLLVPIVNLLPNGGEHNIETVAILTTEKTAGNIRRPLLGQIQTYEVLSLKGTARVVQS